MGIPRIRTPADGATLSIVLAGVRSLSVDGDWLVFDLGHPLAVGQLRVRRTEAQIAMAPAQLSTTGEFPVGLHWILASVDLDQPVPEIAGNLLWFACSRGGLASNPWTDQVPATLWEIQKGITE